MGGAEVQLACQDLGFTAPLQLAGIGLAKIIVIVARRLRVRQLPCNIHVKSLEA